MPDTAPVAEDDHLVVALRENLPHSLGSNLLLADRRRDAPNWVVDWPFFAAILFLLAISIGLLWHPAARELPYYQLVLLQVWGTGFLVFVVALGWLTKRSVLDRFARELAPALSAESKAEAVRRLEAARTRRQWPLTLGATLVGCGLVAAAMLCDLSRFWDLRGDLVLAALFAAWLWSYTIVFVIAIRLGIAATFHGEVVAAFDVRDLESHPLTPDQAGVIRSTLRVSSEMLGFTAATAVYLATLAWWLKELRWFLIVDLTVCLVASIGTGIILYVRVNRRLVHLIEDRRALTLRRIEADLWSLQFPTAGGSPPDPGALQRLSTLYSQVLARNPGLGWRERLKLALPALPPLLALVKLEGYEKLLTALLGPFLAP